MNKVLNKVKNVASKVDNAVTKAVRVVNDKKRDINDFGSGTWTNLLLAIVALVMVYIMIINIMAIRATGSGVRNIATVLDVDELKKKKTLKERNEIANEIEDMSDHLLSLIKNFKRM